MAFYQDKEQRQYFIDTLIDKLTAAPAGATEPYWKQVQSGTYAQDGYILHSKGSSGKDNIYVRFRGYAHYLQISLIEKYTPNAIQGLTGTVENETPYGLLHWSESAYTATFPVHYMLNFDRDRIMLFVRGDYLHSGPLHSFIWLGLPLAMDPNDDSRRATIACSYNAYNVISYSTSNNQGNTGYARMLKRRDQVAQVNVYMRTMTGFKSKGWGGKMRLPNIYLENNDNAEGIRAIMHGVHPLINSDAGDFQHGDEITVGGKRFTIIRARVLNSAITGCFPTDWLAVEQLQ